MTQHNGSAADQSALKGMKPFDEFIVTSGAGVGNKYEFRGEAGWVQTHDASGAALVSVDKTGAAHCRNIAAAATTYNVSTNRCTYTAGEAVTELEIGCVNTTPAAYSSGMAYLVVINAPTSTIASQWLADAGSPSQDVQYEFGYYGEMKKIARTTAILTVDVLPLTAAMRLVIRGV